MPIKVKNLFKLMKILISVHWREHTEYEDKKRQLSTVAQ